MSGLPGYGLHIPHDLLNKGVIVQLFRVHHMAVHNATLGQGLPDGDGVHIVQIILFDLGVEAILLDELGNPALYLGPRQRRSFGAFRADRKRSFSVAAIKLMGQPYSGVFLPCMVFHVANNGVFAFNFTVPVLDCPVDVIVRERAQQLMELGIGLVYDFPMKALPELRGVRIEAKQPHITGPQDGTANSGVALDHGVLVVTVTAGVPVSDVLGNSLQHDGLVLLMQLPEGGGLDGFFVPERLEPVSTILRFMGVDVLFGLMVDRRDGILPALGAALQGGGDRHIMLGPELFQVLLQPVCRKPAHFHTATDRESTGDQLQPQLRRGFFGVLAINLEEIAHLIQDHIIWVSLLDTVVFPHSRVRLRLFLGKRKSRGCFHILCFIYSLDLFSFGEEQV